MESDLPRGAWRAFVEELFEYYRAAHRSTLRQISDRLAQREDLAGTASRETIRRMLQGATVPTRWETVEAVFLVLCELADINPDATQYVDGDSVTSHRQVLEDVWNRALDTGPPKKRFRARDLTEEPPF